MKTYTGRILSMFLLLSLIVAPASATKPGQDVNPNGFPSGPHFNLNLIAKWDDNFICPPQEYYLRVTECTCGNHSAGDLVESCDDLDVCEPTDVPIYGNVIFIPRGEDGVPITDPIEILMESGKKGPKGKIDTAVLEVTDWCTETFDGDPAVLRLPADPVGYQVYARIAGKPGADENDHTIDISPELFYAEDEAGNDFIHLGFIRGDNVFNTDGVELPLRRTDDSKRGNGIKGATRLTGLFEWKGEVCYIDYADYCLDGAGGLIIDPDSGEPICTEEAFCCVDMDDPADGVYDDCDLLTDIGIGDPLACPVELCEGDPITCYPYEQLALMCREYDYEWVFNIADFVGYLWDITSTGAYHVQVRFYPESTIDE